MTSSDPGDAAVTLDDVVARARDLPGRFRSLYVETHGWIDWALSNRAASRRSKMLVPPPPVDPDGRRQRRVERTWMVFDAENWDHPLLGVRPARYRVELHFTNLDGTVDHSISGVDEAWRWSQRDGVSERSARGEGFASLTCAWVVGRHWLGSKVGRELLSTDLEVLGIPCVRVRVTPPPGHWAPAPLHAGDEHHLDIDPETGLTLALTSLFEGETISHHEVVAFELDPEIDPALTAPPDDAPTPPERKHYQDARAVALDAGDLTVFLPTWLPDGFEFQTGHVGPDRDGTTRVTIVYSVERQRFVQLMQFPAPARERPHSTAWTVVERGDRWAAISDVSAAEGTRVAELMRDGTGISIWAGVSADELLDVAFSLEPVDR